MAEALFLIKPGELTLKGENRKKFESQLKWDVKRRLSGIPNRMDLHTGRYYLTVDQADEAAAAAVLSRLPGISSYARVVRTEKSIEAILDAAASLTAAGPLARGELTFKAEARRADKSFPLDSHAICIAVGDRLRTDFPQLSVDVRTPSFTVEVEIRDRAYIYVDQVEGQRGLPSGSSGKALLLLSGGIDSPVAGYLMARRGLFLEAVHFHAYPYTSREAVEKVKRLARSLALYCGPIRLHLVPFTEVQMRIKERARENETTLLMRAAMVEIADRLAKANECGALISGESLGQVASQTMEAMRFTGSTTDLPVFRPLIGMDKQDTISLARRIGTYDISIEPHEDCCVIFSPKHPLLKPSLEAEEAAYGALEIEPLLTKAMSEAEIVSMEAAGNPQYLST